MKLTVNDEVHTIPIEWRSERLLFILREVFGLTGAKYGCGIGQCGACTVIVDGEAQRSCLLTASSLGKADIRTIEGLVASDGSLHPVQQAWLDEAVSQCGYCQAGQIMSAVALLAKKSSPDDAAINEAMEGNLCRCGTYQRIRKAVKRASGSTA